MQGAIDELITRSQLNCLTSTAGTHTHTTVLRLCGICPGKPGEPVPEETTAGKQKKWY